MLALTNLVQSVCEWGRQSDRDRISDYDRQRFGDVFTERLRKHLHTLRNQPEVNGQTNNGYELLTPTGEHVGVSRDKYTKQFHVYYRPASDLSRKRAQFFYGLKEEA